MCCASSQGRAVAADRLEGMRQSRGLPTGPVIVGLIIGLLVLAGLVLKAKHDMKQLAPTSAALTSDDYPHYPHIRRAAESATCDDWMNGSPYEERRFVLD